MSASMKIPQNSSDSFGDTETVNIKYFTKINRLTLLHLANSAFSYSQTKLGLPIHQRKDEFFYSNRLCRSYKIDIVIADDYLDIVFLTVNNVFIFF